MLITITVPSDTSTPSTITVSNDGVLLWSKSRRDTERSHAGIEDMFINDLPAAFEAMIRKGFEGTRSIHVKVGMLKGTISYNNDIEALIEDSVLLGYDEAEARSQASAFSNKPYCLGVFDRTDYRSIKVINEDVEPLAALLGFTQETIEGIYNNGVLND